jgi:hypothetical protein
MFSKKLIRGIKISSFAFVLGLFVLQSSAENNLKPIHSSQSTSEYIKSIYNKINFCSSSILNPFVFERAYRGFVHLKSAQKLNKEKNIIAVCDYSLSANQNRLWVIDLNTNKVLFNTLVAHGQGTGEEFATSFSNQEGSHQSSLGFYVTGDTYMGSHGLSLHLHGMDQGFNTAAYDRAIVLHGAPYVSESFIQQNQRLGRSWGCPAVKEELSTEIIETLKEGTCLFAYFPDDNYLKHSFWLNKKTDALSEEMSQNGFELMTPRQVEAQLGGQIIDRN